MDLHTDSVNFRIQELARGDASSRMYGDPTNLASLNLHDLHSRSWLVTKLVLGISLTFFILVMKQKTSLNVILCINRIGACYITESCQEKFYRRVIDVLCDMFSGTRWHGILYIGYQMATFELHF